MELFVVVNISYVGDIMNDGIGNGRDVCCEDH